MLELMSRPPQPVALVTGAARGIGRAIALELARSRCHIAVHYRSSADDAETTAAEIRTQGVLAETFAADITRPDEATALIERVHTALGGPDILVNNVGNYYQGPLETLEPDTWHAMFDANLHCTFYLCRAALPQMQQKGWGRIVNLGYAGAEILKARPSIAPYAIAKTGVILYSKALAATYAKHGITVNVVSPGIIENSVSKPDLSSLPMGRYGTLDELAGAVRYLASDEAAYVSGVTLEVSGGWNL
jgi:3-oxoacyl-[acyl-carrier protein] reductase